jgi:hypothetical protein
MIVFKMINKIHNKHISINTLVGKMRIIIKNVMKKKPNLAACPLFLQLIKRMKVLIKGKNLNEKYLENSADNYQ